MRSRFGSYMVAGVAGVVSSLYVFKPFLFDRPEGSSMQHTESIGKPVTNTNDTVTATPQSDKTDKDDKL
ncbi:hypothetical protein F5050DRAFT_1904961 [Lentinula boryana]|uniref:Uncharacterized protein n=1 Tax=Lentinula boryana TaxID=40481 RepID=A0ABQ8Q319_9AGAR|nr:hypothetical protein F5050DRAFT_1904961 [Lentinula boryana]